MNDAIIFQMSSTSKRITVWRCSLKNPSFVYIKIVQKLQEMFISMVISSSDTMHTHTSQELRLDYVSYIYSLEKSLRLIVDEFISSNSTLVIKLCKVYFLSKMYEIT